MENYDKEVEDLIVRQITFNILALIFVLSLITVECIDTVVIDWIINAIIFIASIIIIIVNIIGLYKIDEKLIDIELSRNIENVLKRDYDGEERI